MELRYFYDDGGDFLWPADDPAELAFGSPTEISRLPISERTMSLISELMEKIVAAAESDGQGDAEADQIGQLAFALHPILQEELRETGISIQGPH